MILYHALNILRDYTGENIRVTRLESAQTNAVYNLSSSTNDWALRINHVEANLLGIDRRRERHLLTVIEDEKWAPNVIFQSDELLLTSWTFGNSFQISSKKHLIMLLKVLQQIYSFKPKPANSKYSLFVTDQILHLLNQTNRIPAQLRKNILKKCGEYIKPKHLVLCHHDWHPGNIIQHQQGISIIDWEYAAFGDSTIDLACLIIGFKLTIAQQALVLEMFNISTPKMELAICLSEAMSLLWYLVKFPNTPHTERKKKWLDKWPQ